MILFDVTEQSTPPPVGEFVCGSPAITPRIPTGAQSLTNSIVGGQAVIPNSHPWQVSPNSLINHPPRDITNALEEQ